MRTTTITGLAAVAVSITTAAGQPGTVFDCTAFGAVADGRTDAAAAIQRAIDAASEAGGGTVVLPAAAEPYLLRSGLTIAADRIRLEGTGATILMADGALDGRIIDCVQILGTPDDPVEDAAVVGLTIDANYWNQPGSYNPRGLDSDYAERLLVENVTITRAFVGLTFGRGVVDSEARGCVVTRWYDDAFNASGDGFSGSCARNRFVRCTAADSPDESQGGLPGTRNNAWEIEDGAHATTLLECSVSDCGGNGFAVRNHPWDHPVATTATTFVRCAARGVSRNAFSVFGQAYPCTVETVRLERCAAEHTSIFEKDVRGLELVECAFGGMVTIGPARLVRAERSVFGGLRVWSQDVGEQNTPGGYTSSYVFDSCTFEREPWILGNAAFVRFED